MLNLELDPGRRGTDAREASSLISLESSSDSPAILGLAAKAWNAGCNVVRMNMRNCGGTDAWTPTFCHAGMSGDVDVVLRHFVQKFGLERVLGGVLDGREPGIETGR